MKVQPKQMTVIGLIFFQVRRCSLKCRTYFSSFHYYGRNFLQLTCAVWWGTEVTSHVLSALSYYYDVIVVLFRSAHLCVCLSLVPGCKSETIWQSLLGNLHRGLQSWWLFESIGKARPDPPRFARSGVGQVGQGRADYFW